MRAPQYLDSGDVQAPNGEIFHRTADGWKLSVPAQVIPGFANAQLHPGGS
ncbi:MAG TPA: hypothetical protein VFE31_05625 [Opitutaceae bacterium]|nr:hypothetical protein [Opitutaceae bacterium]